MSDSIKVKIWSYKKAQNFKKDYVRLNGEFIQFQKSSANHKIAILEVREGDQLDARASVYTDGNTWNAHRFQSWAKFEVRDGELVALNFDGQRIAAPEWIQIVSQPVAA